MLDSEFDGFCDMWDKAVKDKVFKDAPKPHIPTPKLGGDDDFFGGHHPSPEMMNERREVGECDSQYWNEVFQRSLGRTTPDAAFNEDWSVEGKTVKNPPQGWGKSPKISKEGLKGRSDMLGNTPNPVQYPSYGKDQGDRKVTPNWTDGDELIELHNLKIDLEKLESKFNAWWGVGDDKKLKPIQKQIEKVKTQIDELSNSLTPNFLSDYLS